MRYSLCIHDDAKEDLENLWLKDATTAALISVFLEQLEVDQTLLDALTIQDYGRRTGENFNVSKWYEYWRKGYGLWRLKILELEARGVYYRIIYAFEPLISRYHVLGIIDRDFNYDSNDHRTKRILAAYDSLCIQKY